MVCPADDCRKDKKHGMGGEEEDLIILSEMLLKIIEETMQIYWNFLRSDERNVVLKTFQESQVEHKDLELLIDIRRDLQKVCFITSISNGSALFY